MLYSVAVLNKWYHRHVSLVEQEGWIEISKKSREIKSGNKRNGNVVRWFFITNNKYRLLFEINVYLIFSKLNVDSLLYLSGKKTNIYAIMLASHLHTNNSVGGSSSVHIFKE